MKIAVLGSGVIGVTSAWYLAQSGHEVTVIDRRSGPGQETSFANAGEISPGYASPWAAPGIWRKLLRWTLLPHAPLIIRPRLDLKMLRWLLAFCGNTTQERYLVNKRAMVELADFSLQCLHELRRRTGIQYDGRSLGTLQLFRTAAQMSAVAEDTELLSECGIRFELLDRTGCMRVEPGLAHAQASFAGGLRLPCDETGDCFKFTVELQRLAAQLGAAFLYNRKILGLENRGDTVTKVITDSGDVCADAYVVALGSFAPSLLTGVMQPIPVYPVKGYSLTVPITAPDLAPQSTVMDEQHKVAMTRLGDRMRVGGLAEVTGFNCELSERRRLTLEHSLRGLFPRAGDPREASFWSGLRPMTPDGPPIVGSTRVRNLLLNIGHGSLGWTMACGSARIIADIVDGREPQVDVSRLSLSRYFTRRRRRNRIGPRATADCRLSDSSARRPVMEA